MPYCLHIDFPELVLTPKPLLASVLVLTSALSAQTPGPVKDWTPAANAWWSHVQYLADDKLEGRRAGSPGYFKAVEYVESQFQNIGLKPAGTSKYRQDVELVPTSVDVDKSSFAVDKVSYELGTDLQLNAHVDGAGTVDAPMVFLGYGLSLPKKHIDDVAGENLKGKVVVIYGAAPENVLGPQRAYARIAGERWKALHAAGAIGMVLFTPPRPGAPPSPVATPRNAPPPVMLFADPALESLPGLKVYAALTEKGATRLFASAGKSFAEIKATGDAGKPLPHFAFPGTLHAVTAVKTGEHLHAPNVVGLMEGSDPKLKKEYLVISAHLDHLGIGRAVEGDTIYNGAMDNASGVASLMETARLLAAGPRPKRSILFVALSAEEMGELGSQYFASKPTVPKPAIVGDLNMDMYLPLFPLRYLEIQGLGESTLGNDARAVCQLNDVEPQFDKQPDENRFIRSDQVNFVKQGIPALAFKFGWTPDSPEEKTFNDWVKVRYHRPSDDLQQPVDKVGAAQFSSLLAQLALRVADAKARPEWYPESSFAATKMAAK